jgi:acetyl-CoA synthetase
VPARFAFPEEVFDAWAEDRGRLAACAANRRATFWDLRDASRRLAGVLAEAGLGEGERVAIVLPIGIDWAVAQLAILRMRAVGAALDPEGAETELVTAFDAVAPAAVIADGTVAAKLGAVSVPIRASIDGGRPGWIDARRAPARAFEERPRPPAPGPVRIEPRAGARSHLVLGGGWLHAQRAIAESWLDLRRTDLFWPVVRADDPLALALVVGAWSVGAPVLLQRGDEPDVAFARYPISVLHAPAAAYATLARAASALRDLRHCTTSDRLDADAAEAWRDSSGLAIHSGFGVPECPLLLAHLRGLPVRPGSVGRPLPGHDVRVIDAAGAETGDEETGEIVLRGRPPTRAVEIDRIDVEDTLRTGVRGRRDAQGYIRLVDPVA